MSFETTSSLLFPYKEKIETEIALRIAQLGPNTRLRDACSYALLNGGKRFRPTLVCMVAEALEQNAPVIEAAIAVEFFHTASLIADDLPCMDNDDLRRNKPSTHKVYGENIALLASYGLISAGYGCLAKNAELIGKSTLSFANSGDKICRLALETATYTTGLLGATGGQFLDAFPPDETTETCLKVIQEKTCSLFELSLVLGWLYGGGRIEEIKRVKKAGSHLGMAFQIADDLEDAEEDERANRKMNMALLLGKEEAYKLFELEKAHFFNELRRLGLAHVNSPLTQLL
jgi:geranylgeranyl diphosphate synthase type II